MQTAAAIIDPYATNTEALFLAFRLAGQDYGIAITKVQEIREWSKVTPLPNSPSYIKGMLNLRGAMVLHIDTARKTRKRITIEMTWGETARKPAKSKKTS